MTDMVKNQIKDDRIKISEDVVATIAGIAASGIEDIATLSGGLVDGIAGMLGRKNPGKGIKVDMKDNNVSIELSVTMQYGCKIHEVSREIQVRVREAVENMTGMQVTGVNINVIGINIGKESKKIEVLEELPPLQV